MCLYYHYLFVPCVLVFLIRFRNAEPRSQRRAARHQNAKHQNARVETLRSQRRAARKTSWGVRVRWRIQSVSRFLELDNELQTVSTWYDVLHKLRSRDVRILW